MTKKLLPLIITLLSVLSLHAQNAPDGYYIKDYNVQMTVHDDNSYNITERISVYFTEPRHGIYRMIPLHPSLKRDISEKQDGSETEVKDYELEVSDITVSEDYESDYEWDVQTLRIGSADKEVLGNHTYTISYLLKAPWDRVSQADVFFYSVLGTGWECDINRFSFDVRFDKPLPANALEKMNVYVGSLGSHDTHTDSLCISSTTTRIAGSMPDIQPNTAVSVFIPLPEGYFSYDLWQDTVALSLAVLAILLLLYVLYKEFTVHHGVMKIMTVVPPKDMSSAEVGTVFDCSVDDCDIISLIPWFANKGYLSVNNEGKHPVLKKLKDIPDSAPQYQKLFFNALFAKGDTFDCGKKTDKEFGEAWLKTKEKLQTTFKNKLNQIDYKVVLTWLAAILAAAFSVSVAKCVEGYVLGMVLFFMMCIIGFIMCIIGSGKRRGWFAKILVALFVCAAIIGVGALTTYTLDAELYLSPEPFGVLIPLLGIVSLFMCKLDEMTPYRREKMGEILGLEEFIRMSEEPQLRQLQAQEERYFYDVLPFAVALGMSEIWARKFANITILPAEGYDGTMSPLTTAAIAHNFLTPSVRAGISAHQQALAQAASSGSSHGSSSSFSVGGGGFAGGGFGGGGGGSW